MLSLSCLVAPAELGPVGVVPRTELLAARFSVEGLGGGGRSVLVIVHELLPDKKRRCEMN